MNTEKFQNTIIRIKIFYSDNQDIIWYYQKVFDFTFDFVFDKL